MAPAMQTPIDAPLVRAWYFLPIFMLAVFGMMLGGLVGGVARGQPLPFPVRAGAALAAWLLPMAGLILLRPWMNRLDEFQKQIVSQSVAWAGIWTVLYIVAMAFYFTLMLPGIHGALVMIGGAPGACAFAAAGMIWMLERRARRKTAGARE